MAVTTPRKPSRSRRSETMVSSPPPREMSREDICNVEPVSADELMSTLDGLVSSEGIDRWTLSEGGAS